MCLYKCAISWKIWVRKGFLRIPTNLRSKIELVQGNPIFKLFGRWVSFWVEPFAKISKCVPFCHLCKKKKKDQSSVSYPQWKNLCISIVSTCSNWAGFTPTGIIGTLGCCFLVSHPWWACLERWPEFILTFCVELGWVRLYRQWTGGSWWFRNNKNRRDSTAFADLTYPWR